ncbi:LPS-assembly protein LptD [Jhaorihella thermophila]
MTEYLEPILQAGWTSVSNRNVPLDEGTFQEFDQGNLLSLSRFPAADRRENGATVVYGLNWARHAQAGWKAAATIGQVFRSEAQPDFTWTSGLNGTSSDILLAGQFVSSDGLSLTARGLLSGSLDFSMAELRGGWNSHALSVAGTYVWLGRDPVVGRTTPVSEIWFDGDYDFLPNWSAGARLRYDTEGTQPIYAGFNLAYENECVTVDLSINRRYTSSTSVEPSTSFGLSVALSGFSVKGGAQKLQANMQQSILSHLARPAAALRAVLTARRGALTAAATAAALGIATAGGVTRTASAQSLFLARHPGERRNDFPFRAATADPDDAGAARAGRCRRARPQGVDRRAAQTRGDPRGGHHRVPRGYRGGNRGTGAAHPTSAR